MWERVSDTIQLFDGVRYYRCGRYFRRDGVLLHRLVYERTRGRIPNGYHIHHVDHDPSNNDPSNLRAMPRSEHLSTHMREPASRERSRRSVAAAIAAAPAWHASGAGRAWHSEHMRKIHAAGKLGARYDRRCEHCGAPFRTASSAGRFCSNPCKTYARRASGVDNEARACAYCAASFVVNRYDRRRTCTRSCATRLAHAARRAA